MNTAYFKNVFKFLFSAIFALAFSFSAFSASAVDIPSGLLGTWGHQILGHHGDGTWHTEANRVTFSNDGTGVLDYKFNDNETYSSGTQNFTYRVESNDDGSLTIWFTGEGESEAEPSRLILSDDGNMILVDGTDDKTRQELEILIRLDPSKTYTNADLSGNSYMIGYEHDAQGGDKGYYRASSGISSSNGGGTLSLTSGMLNGDGTLHPISMDIPYTVNPDGSVVISGTGYLSGKLFMRSNPDSGFTDDWENNFAMSKGDKTYSTADLEGKWAVVGFGDDNGTSFVAEVGTLEFDSGGNFTYTFKSQVDGTVSYDSGTYKWSVSEDGSFGASLPGSLPYSGAIGNDGKTIIFNESFALDSLTHREVFVGVRCSSYSQEQETSAGISFTGVVADSTGSGVTGATVALAGNASVSTTTGTGGSFVISGIPEDSNFSLKISKDGYRNTYSQVIRSSSNINNASSPFILYTDAQTIAWGVTSGKGVIVGRVWDKASVGFVQDASVSCTSAMGQTYTVYYSGGGTTSTAADGKYMIPNVLNGDTVYVTATYGGGVIVFDASVFMTHADAISEGMITGTSDGNTITLRNTFDTALGLLNDGDISGFMTYVSGDYLDDGMTKALFETELNEEFEDQAYMVLSTEIDGDMATMVVLWNGMDVDVLSFRNESGNWKFYGNQEPFAVMVNSGCMSPDGGSVDNYWVSLEVEDPGDVVTAVTVAGGGLDGSVSLNHDGEEHLWRSWSESETEEDNNPSFGSTKPDLPLTYTFTVTYNGSITETFTASVNSFLEVFPADPSPAEGETVSGELSFTWTPVAGYEHDVELYHRNGSQWERIWEKEYTGGFPVAYDGTVALVEGGYYFYYITTENGDDSYSLLQINFTYGAPAGADLPGLSEAILALQVLVGKNPDTGGLVWDISGDGKIGIAEVISILQCVTGFRTEYPILPYVSDSNTVLLDHFDGSTSASILGYVVSDGCGSAKTSITPSYSYSSGHEGLGQALSLSPPDETSVSYLKYPDGQLLSQPNGTIEFWLYLTEYGQGMSLVEQGPYPGSCAGWTYYLGILDTGVLRSAAWDAFDVNSGETLVPLNQWTHIASTWGSTGAKLYINGVLVGSDTNTKMPASGYGGSVMVNYGVRNVTTKINELRISNVQRTIFRARN